MSTNTKRGLALKIVSVLIILLVAVTAVRAFINHKPSANTRLAPVSLSKPETPKTAPVQQEQTEKRKQSEAELDRLNDTLDKLIKH